MKSSEPICKAVVAPHTTDEEIGSEWLNVSLKVTQIENVRAQGVTSSCLCPKEKVYEDSWILE